jgi:hypothetical protein
MDRMKWVSGKGEIGSADGEFYLMFGGRIFLLHCSCNRFSRMSFVLLALFMSSALRTYFDN